jgi:hypothetical protein
MNAPGCLATAPAAVCAPLSLSLARALSLSSSRMLHLPPPLDPHRAVIDLGLPPAQSFVTTRPLQHSVLRLLTESARRRKGTHASHEASGAREGKGQKVVQVDR